MLSNFCANRPKFAQIIFRKLEYNSTLKKLKNNRAYRNKGCYLPPQRALPVEPKTACSDLKECREEGSLICYSKFLGAEGCTIAAKKYDIPGLLSAPACSAFVAEIAGDKYGMGDAVLDFFQGYIDDYADTQIKNGSFMNQVGGWLLKGANLYGKTERAELCVDSFVEKHLGPKLSWEKYAERIIAEPKQTRKRCYSMLGDVNYYNDKIKEIDRKVYELEKQFDLVNVEYKKLIEERSPIIFCE